MRMYAVSVLPKFPVVVERESQLFPLLLRDVGPLRRSGKKSVQEEVAVPKVVDRCPTETEEEETRKENKRKDSIKQYSSSSTNVWYKNITPRHQKKAELSKGEETKEPQTHKVRSKWGKKNTGWLAQMAHSLFSSPTCLRRAQSTLSLPTDFAASPDEASLVP